jgi:dipeptidyl aminopeptidase/acylaminoacyl peptidase
MKVFIPNVPNPLQGILNWGKFIFGKIMVEEIKFIKFVHNKKMLLPVIIFLVIIFAILTISSVTTVFKTAMVWVDIFVPQSEQLLDFFIHIPSPEKYSIESKSGRILPAHLYLPPGKDKIPAMIIYVPFIGGGIEDPRLVNVAKSFARAGFAVLIPSRSEDKLVMSAKDKEDVVSLFLFLEEHPRVNPNRVGLIGASYGSGPVIMAAADEEIRERVRFVMSAAGYYDFKNTLRFIVTGSYSYRGIEGKLEPWFYTREILKETLVHHQINDNLFEKFISQPKLFEELFKKTPEIRELGSQLSPSTVIDDVQARFFVFHSTDDILIPYTESMRLADALRDRVPVKFALLSMLEHGIPRPFTLKNIRQYYLSSIFDSYIFLYHLLSEQWRK